MINHRHVFFAFFLFFLSACGGPKDLVITPLPISDQNYIRGISKTGDFLALPSQANFPIEVGDYLIFSDLLPRVIAKVENWEKILGVRVYGEPMNGNIIGNPNTIRLLKKFQTPINLNDLNYEKGIAKAFNGFAVPNCEQALKIYSAGNEITLGDGVKRRVIKQNLWGSIIGVQLSGPSIDIARAGFPNVILF